MANHIPMTDPYVCHDHGNMATIVIYPSFVGINLPLTYMDTDPSWVNVQLLQTHSPSLTVPKLCLARRGRSSERAGDPRGDGDGKTGPSGRKVMGNNGIVLEIAMKVEI